MKPALSTRQAEIAELVARGLPNKVIAARKGIAIETVKVHVKEAAAKIPGDSPPRHKLTLWFFGVTEG